ncbi:MAG: hypothetical protein JST00_45830 [Deltaproteobacteria bacterium]|nr:hypothetical protein [Deltaproteobacteria bacterium]
MRRKATLLLPLALAAACGGATTGGDAPIDASADAATDVVDRNCPGLDRFRQGPHPTGACQRDAVCEFTDAFRSCGPNDKFYPPQKQWRCTCPEGEWTCVSVGGGLGLVPCDDDADGGAGADADATARDAAAE